MKILAIDPGVVTGWATSPSTYGEWNLKDSLSDSPELPLYTLKKRLVGATKDIDLVAYEQSFVSFIRSAARLSEFIAIIKLVCSESKIPFIAYTPTEVKRRASGKGNANKEVLKKKAQEMFGYNGESTHEVDALFVWHIAFEDNK